MGVREGDLERIREPFDFLGINLYTRSLVRAVEDDPHGIAALPIHTGGKGLGGEGLGGNGLGGDTGPRTDFGWEVWPEALREMVLRVTRDYDTPALEITENGCAYGDGPDADGTVRDRRRIDFHRGYLEALARAIDEGADVRGYHAWSLLDNFEWAEGYDQRFGLVHVNFETADRTLKESGRWYGRVAAENGFDT
jgi:beta-glucosidase